MIQALGILSLIMSLSTAGLFYLYDNEKENRIKSESALQQVKVTLQSQKDDFNLQIEKNTALNVRMTAVQIKADIAQNELDTYRNREKLLQKKPKAIERLANAATNKLWDDILRASSGRKDSDKKAEASTDTTN